MLNRGGFVVRRILIIICVIVLATMVLADGLIVPDGSGNCRFVMNYHNVSISIEDGVAIVTIVEEFQNISDQVSEAVYLFPIPTGAVIDEFIMKTGDQVLRGEIFPADEARQIYQDIVARLKDPALLEYIGHALVKLSVFPFEVGERREITVRYIQPLEISGNSCTMVYPLKIEENLAGPIGDINVRVSSDDPDLVDLFSPTHNFELVDTTFGREYVFSATEYTPYSDMVILLTSSVGEIPSSLACTWDSVREEGYFMLTLIPKMNADELIPKDVVLIFDISGSMYGDKIDQAKEALGQILQLLRKDDRFAIITFDDRIRNLTGGLVYASYKDLWLKRVKEIEADGSTNIYDALKEGINVLSSKDTSRFKTILFLTDGEPTAGNTDIGSIINDSTQIARSENVHIFSFGIGMGVNAELLDRLVQENAGKVSYIVEGETIEGKVTGLYKSIETPALENVSVYFEGVLPVHLVPEGPYTLFAGNALRLFGMYHEPGRFKIYLSGRRGNTIHDYAYVFLLTHEDHGNTFIMSLWAQKRVSDLANRYRYDRNIREPEREEIKQEIVALSKRFNIINEFTSYLIAPESELFLSSTRDSYAPTSGAQDILAAKSVAEMAEDKLGIDGTGNFVFVEGERFFEDDNGVWRHDNQDLDEQPKLKVKVYSPAYFRLLGRSDWIRKVASLGEKVIFNFEGVNYELGSEGIEEEEDLN